MKKVCILIMVALALTACEQKPNINEIEAKLEQQKPIETKSEAQPTKEALKALDQTLSTNNKTLTAKEIKFSTIAYQYNLPDEMKQICGFDGKLTDKETGEIIKFCTEIDMKLAKIDPVWIEQIVNKQITGDDNPKLLKFKQTLDDFVAEHLAFVKEMQEISEENNEEFTYPPMYSWTETPDILPAYNNIAQIVITSDTYMGGAHGVQGAEYLLFDMDLQSQINLNDVLEKNKESDFFELAHSAFKAYLKQELQLNTPQEIKEYEDGWQFELAENFYFDERGLVLVYQPYQIGTYAQGFVELTIPFDELAKQDILKVQYLPKKII